MHEQQATTIAQAHPQSHHTSLPMVENSGGLPNTFEQENAASDADDGDADLHWEPQYSVLWCCTRDSAIRSLCIRCMLHSAFDAIVLVVIILNSITMALEDPLEDPNHPSDRTQALQSLELIFNIIFSVEMLVKIVAMGFVMKANT
eukprot:SAG31_NODE_1869_length_7028_cov_2.847164_3_plen_146_part_00